MTFEIENKTKVLTCKDTNKKNTRIQLTDDEHTWIQLTIKIREPGLVWDWLNKQVSLGRNQP